MVHAFTHDITNTLKFRDQRIHLEIHNTEVAMSSKRPSTFKSTEYTEEQCTVLKLPMTEAVLFCSPKIKPE